MQLEDDYFDYSEPLGVGSIQHLNDHPPKHNRKIPLGFPIPQEDPMKQKLSKRTTTKRPRKR